MQMYPCHQLKQSISHHTEAAASMQNKCKQAQKKCEMRKEIWNWQVNDMEMKLIHTMRNYSRMHLNIDMSR